MMVLSLAYRHTLFYQDSAAAATAVVLVNDLARDRSRYRAQLDLLFDFTQLNSIKLKGFFAATVALPQRFVCLSGAESTFFPA